MTNNLCHTFFHRATSASFYLSSSKLASLFLEDFKTEVPCQSQALVGMAVSNNVTTLHRKKC